MKSQKPRRKRKTRNYKMIAIIAIFVFYGTLQLLSAFHSARPISSTIGLNELYKMIDNNEIESIRVKSTENEMIITKKDGTIVNSVNPQNDEFILDLMKRGVNIEVQKQSLFSALTTIALMIPTTIVMAMIAVYLTNTIIGASTKMFTILKSKTNNVSFDDIKGLGDTKKEVQFIVNQLKNSSELKKHGARVCKGVLFYGPPGTGKTMLAKAIAKESGVSFISASGSDFNEVFVGVGAARVRALWELAITNAPCILFIDEIDCLGKRRKGGDGASNDHNQTLNALLQKMDGLNESYDVMVIGATNRKEDLDDALLRPGRFDRHYYVGEPDNKKDRDEIVEVYLRNKTLSDGVNTETVSKLMVGLTGAEIEQSLNEAVYISIQNDRNGELKLSDIDEAVMQLKLGGIKKEHSSQSDINVTATHEAAHTIVSLALGIDISKVSIIPYSSGTGGVTMRDIDKTSDIKLRLKSDYENDIKILLAGKVGEEVLMGEHTQGCSSDIEKATEIIYNMVTQWGFSKVGLLNQNVLIKNGLKQSVESDIIKECNEMLSKYDNDVRELIRRYLPELKKLRKILISEKVIVNPTLKMLIDHEESTKD